MTMAVTFAAIVWSMADILSKSPEFFFEVHNIGGVKFAAWTTKHIVTSER